MSIFENERSYPKAAELGVSKVEVAGATDKHPRSVAIQKTYGH